MKDPNAGYVAPLKGKVSSMQKTQMKCIVITDDNWLYAGVASLFPAGGCYRVTLKGVGLIPLLSYKTEKNVLIVVDCQLLYQGGGTVFHHVVHLFQRSQVIWLTLKNTGRLFPEGGDIQGMLARSATVTQFCRMMLLTRQWRSEEINTPCSLTHMEQALFSQLLNGKNIPQLARIYGKSIKTLYRHQRNILQKTGFPTICFLLYIYHQNRNVLTCLAPGYQKNKHGIIFHDRDLHPPHLSDPI
ncbi:helix-turn-helix transcriptional regulator [Enterobacter chuandaensis]